MENEIKDRDNEVKAVDVKTDSEAVESGAKKAMSTRLKMGIKAGGFNVTL